MWVRLLYLHRNGGQAKRPSLKVSLLYLSFPPVFANCSGSRQVEAVTSGAL